MLVLFFREPCVVRDRMLLQMGLLHLLVAALAASAAMAADSCLCVKEQQTIDPISSPMIFFQNPTTTGEVNGIPCIANCTFTATLDKNADKYSLQIQVLTNKLGDGTLVFDGTNAANNVINSNTPAGVLPYNSYGDSITIYFTEPPTNKGEFMIVVSKVPGRPDPPVVKTTTLAPPTAAYDPKFTHNPRLVANDIMLAFDLSSKDIEKYKTFARNLIKELAINPKSLDSTDTEDCGAGSRLSLVGLSALSGFDNLYAPYWTTSAEQADGNINSFVQIASGDFFFEPINKKYIYGFHAPEGETNSTKFYTNCANKEKILILLTSTSPAEYKTDMPNDDPFPTDYLGKGVHQIVVRYTMTDKDKAYYDLAGKTDTNNRWNAFELSGGDKDVENFFNTYLVDSIEPMTCQLTATNNKVDVVIGTGMVPVSIPPYYSAVGVVNGDWNTDKHYCNFQETTVRLIKDSTLVDPEHPDKKTQMCVKVFYDLETGKDFVSIFSGDPNQSALQEELVRLTGRDVSGTYFELPDAIGSIVFTSDEKNVFDGFYAEITQAPCPVTP